MAGTVSNMGIRVTIVSTYPPRRCGIATFSRDLAAALADAAPDVRVEICALDRDGLAYPAMVRTVIRQAEPGDYRRPAAELPAPAAAPAATQPDSAASAG